MIALGITRAGAEAPGPCRTADAGPFALLLAHATDAASPRDRLALQIRAARILPALLPFAPRRAVDPGDARNWAQLQESAVLAALNRLAGTCQMTLDLRHDLPAPAQPGAWLRHRAVPDRARAALARLPALRDVRLGSGGRIDLLVPSAPERDLAGGIADCLATALPPGWSGRLTGPWAPSAFVGLGTP
ncbi:hypothetical protein HKCCE3408_06220 [Rhodobacterales bacterium HKCCE3408]|nr:hypothetical protein [Rhodobacterales bacterium HKCCE3408]